MTAEPLTETIFRRSWLAVRSPVLVRRAGLRVWDGDAKFVAVIVDQDFLCRIRAGEQVLGKGDLLAVELRRVQFAAEGKLCATNYIDRVHEHRTRLQALLM